MQPKLIPMLVVLSLAALAGNGRGQEIVRDPVAPSRFALPSDTGHYLGYYVGGGAVNARKAEPRPADEASSLRLP